MKIAIDGPSASGKGTLAKALAKKYSLTYLDTGAIFRVIALYAINKNLDNENLLKSLDKIEFKFDKNCQVFLNGENVSKRIRNEDIGQKSSMVSIIPEVRNKVYEIKDDYCKKDVVADGRDVGSVIIPDADIKISLTANKDTRILRRYKELKTNDDNIQIVDVKKNIEERDTRDTFGENASLQPVADDALYIDNSNLTINETIQKVVNYIKGE